RGALVDRALFETGLAPTLATSPPAPAAGTFPAARTPDVAGAASAGGRRLLRPLAPKATPEAGRSLEVASRVSQDKTRVYDRRSGQAAAAAERPVPAPSAGAMGGMAGMGGGSGYGYGRMMGGMAAPAARSKQPARAGESELALREVAGRRNLYYNY